MALSLASTRSVAGLRHGHASASRPCMRPVVSVRAAEDKGMGEKVGEAFVGIFSPAKDNGVNWEGTGTEFKGKISHHGAGKPFKDGYGAGKKAATAQGEEASPPPQAEAEAEEGQGDYIGEAVQNLVAHNFTGDDTEPPAGAGSAGWKGDIHGKKTDGFHARKV